VGIALRSYGYSGAELRLHWARRGSSRDGPAVVRAAAVPAGGEGEDAAAVGKSSSSKAVAVQGSESKVDLLGTFGLVW
jgi:starch synthase